MDNEIMDIISHLRSAQSLYCALAASSTRDSFEVRTHQAKEDYDALIKLRNESAIKYAFTADALSKAIDILEGMEL